MTTAEPILIWGAGAIGGTLGAYCARAGVPVLLVDIVPEHVEACRTIGALHHRAGRGIPAGDPGGDAGRS
jgi:ketopantoate reductase